jgi:hypothetical protein
MIGTKDASGPLATPQTAAASIRRKPAEDATRVVRHPRDIEQLNPLNLITKRSSPPAHFVPKKL